MPTRYCQSDENDIENMVKNIKCHAQAAKSSPSDVSKPKDNYKPEKGVKVRASLC